MVAPYLSKALLLPQHMSLLPPLSALRHHCRRRRLCWRCCYRVPPAVPAASAPRRHLQSPCLPASLLQLSASLPPCCSTCNTVSLSSASMLQHLQHDTTCSTCSTCRTAQPAVSLFPCLPAAAPCLHASLKPHLQYSLPASLLQLLQCSLPASLLQRQQRRLHEGGKVDGQSCLFHKLQNLQTKISVWTRRTREAGAISCLPVNRPCQQLIHCSASNSTNSSKPATAAAGIGQAAAASATAAADQRGCCERGWRHGATKQHSRM